jgi:hypothetical protein
VVLWSLRQSRYLACPRPPFVKRSKHGTSRFRARLEVTTLMCPCVRVRRRCISHPCSFFLRFITHSGFLILSIISCTGFFSLNHYLSHVVTYSRSQLFNAFAGAGFPELLQHGGRGGHSASSYSRGAHFVLSNSQVVITNVENVRKAALPSNSWRGPEGWDGGSWYGFGLQ